MDHHDRKTYRPISTKETIQCFPLHSIVEHTAGIIETDILLIILLSKVFEMFQMRLF